MFKGVSLDQTHKNIHFTVLRWKQLDINENIIV